MIANEIWKNVTQNKLPEITVNLEPLLSMLKESENSLSLNDVRAALQLLKQLHRNQFEKKYAVANDNERENHDMWFFWNGKEYLTDAYFLLNQDVCKVRSVTSSGTITLTNSYRIGYIKREIEQLQIVHYLWDYSKAVNLYPYYVVTVGKDCDGYSKSKMYGFFNLETAEAFAHNCNQHSDGIRYNAISEINQIMEYISENEISETSYRLVKPMLR